MIDRIIQSLRDHRKEAACEAMEQPGDGSSFIYGRSVGVYQGLMMAEGIIDGLLKEQDRKERNS